MKILMTDDDSDDRMMALLAFKKLNAAHSIDFVTNGQELIDYLNLRINSGGDLPDLILLDLNMPKKNGREVLQELKQHPVFKSIPVVVYTTTKNEMEIRRCYELGANTYIVKPARFEALLKVVEDVRNYWFGTASIPSF